MLRQTRVERRDPKLPRSSRFFCSVFSASCLLAQSFSFFLPYSFLFCFSPSGVSCVPRMRNRNKTKRCPSLKSSFFFFFPFFFTLIYFFSSCLKVHSTKQEVVVEKIREGRRKETGFRGTKNGKKIREKENFKNKQTRGRNTAQREGRPKKAGPSTLDPRTSL